MTTVMNLLAMKLTFVINTEQFRVEGTDFAFWLFCLELLILASCSPFRSTPTPLQFSFIKIILHVKFVAFKKT